MSVIGQRLGIAALFCIAIALIVAWWLHTYERVERTIDLPPRGEAAYNPLYALKLALRTDGVDAQSRQHLRIDAVPLGKRDTVLLLNDPRTLSRHERERLMTWAFNGGHLIVRTPPPGPLQKDAEVPILSDLGLTATDAAPDCVPMQVPGLPDHVEFCAGRRFFATGDVEGLVAWGDGEIGYVYARVAYGEGSVDVVADVDFLTNEKLKEGPHLALARQLLQPNYDSGIVHLVYAASMPPLWRLLLDHAWMAWAPLLLALLVWLWMRAQRLGPRLPSPAQDRRSLIEHVQASGEHLYRYGRAYALYAAVHDAFIARLRRRDPYAAALEGPIQASAIAARTGMTIADVEAALRSPRPNDAADFRLRIAKLVQLRNRI